MKGSSPRSKNSLAKGERLTTAQREKQAAKATKN
jgi:hypothetical protein